MNSNSLNGNTSLAEKVRRKIFGAPRDLQDASIFHKLALIPLFAWIGLGADGLSSSAYGPEEAFRTLGSHSYLALFLGLAAAMTVGIIAYAYSRIIEHFPHGGGGYIVATHMLGQKAGVISGCALLVDYMMTITVSVASCVDALFSYLPLEFHKYKIITGCLLIGILVIMNIRGVKESILVMAPIFMVFLVTHALLIGYTTISHAREIAPVVHHVHSSLNHDLSTIGFLGVMLIFLRAYSLGGGTYTGIEAVSNGLQIMRDPKVQTGKRTMVYMATSLALTAGGLLLCYLLIQVKPAHGVTLNAVLASAVFGQWPLGKWLALITIVSEGALLLVAAQAGFIDGPRVMGNMAVDSWFPRRFAAFSDRLTMRNGVLMMGVAALLLMIYTRGSITALVVMYSINVFLTFSISEFGMSRFFIKHRKSEAKWKQHLSVHLTGLTLCLTILIITTLEKFTHGGWLTLVITTTVIMACYAIQGHYAKIRAEMRQLDKLVKEIPSDGPVNNEPVNKDDITAVQLVGGFNGFGVHTLLSISRAFPGVFKNYIFVSVAQVDQGLFKGEEGLEELKKNSEEALKKYVELARKLGFAADFRMEVGTDVVESSTDICFALDREFKNATVFAGQLTFSLEKFYHRFLHNETAYAIQRRLQTANMKFVIMPINIDALKTA